MESTRAPLTLKLYRSDPLAVLLLDKLRGTPLSIAIVVALLPLAVYAGVCAAAGCLMPGLQSTGMLSDLTFIALSLVMVPAMWAFYAWMPRGICDTFAGLHRNGVIVRPKPAALERYGPDYDFPRFLVRMEQSFNQWRFTLLPVLAVFLYVTLFWSPLFPTLQRAFAPPMPAGITRDWFDVTGLTGYLRDVLIMVDQYIGAVIVLKVLNLVLWLRRLFASFDVNIRPLHPDGAGGLMPLGDFVLKIGYLIACLGFGLVCTIMNNQARAGQVGIEAWRGGPTTAFALYVVLAPVSFFAPLGTAHGIMKVARDRLHCEVSERREAAYEDAVAALRTGGADLSTKVQCLEDLRKLHDIISDFPVWPFSAGTVARFSASVLSPIVLPTALTVAQIVVTWLVG